MLYIGFSLYSHKKYSQILCHKYKHCAPVTICGANVIIYQFVHVNKMAKVSIKKDDIKILKQHGWKFIKYSNRMPYMNKKLCFTCVQFTKHACGIKDIKIQTPDELLKYITKK